MKLLSDWIILNLGATLAFSALWVAVVVVVAAFMGVRAGFVRVVGWVSGLFARKRDQAIKTLSDVVTPVAIGGQAPQPQSQPQRFNDKWQGRGRKPVAAGPDWWRRFFELVAADDASRAAGAAMAHDDRVMRDEFGRNMARLDRFPPAESELADLGINAGAGKPIVVGSAEWLASCPVRDWRGTGGAREDRETVIEATWQGRGKGFSDPGHVARLDAAFSRGVIHTGGRDTVAS